MSVQIAAKLPFSVESAVISTTTDWTRFLCAECGYCAYGTFQYELTAGVATNAVAITNDREFERVSQMAKFASSLHRELRTALREKLAGLVSSRKKTDDDDDNAFGSQALKHAFQGVLPLQPGGLEEGKAKSILSQLGKAGSVVKLIARHEGNRSLHLSRATNRSIDSILIHTGNADEESASGLLGGLLESSGRRLAGLDPADPLSRLLVSVQSRRERQNTEEGASGVQHAKMSQNNAKEILQESDRLYQLMREAEREAYELERRCIAWRRLEDGCLGETGIETNGGFEPSHCSVCSATVALQLLVLWLRIFQLDPDSVVITQEMISLLLNDDPAILHMKNLQETKRAAVKEIALRSKQGSPLVLEALRLRLSP